MRWPYNVMYCIKCFAASKAFVLGSHIRNHIKFLRKKSKMIDKMAWLHLHDGRMLRTRSRDDGRYYLPGGKREPGHTAAQILLRKIREELPVALDPVSLQLAGLFQTPAHGEVLAHSHSAGVLVRRSCCYARHAGQQ